MADEMVMATQKWLNKTYSNVSGFGSVPENGKTGWPTIYGLIRGLQVELGITSLVDSFGPTTSAYYDSQITPKWGNNLSKNVIYLIQGAFWCKGIGPGGFDGIYSQTLDSAVKELKYDAGFSNGSGVLDSTWAKALFDMSAFVLVLGGDPKVRSMQQWLNINYSDYTGIMPCDGIYQRSSNEALIYALQAELGYSPDEATGSYGNGTTNATYPVSEGDSGNYVRIVQYGLFVNGYYQSGAFDGIFSSYMGSEVLSFRKFMILPNYTTIADMTVIKGLLSSAGNTMRPASGADASTQLTPAMIKTLVENDVEIIGRYLTGTVGVGADKRDKNLTIEELQNIFTAGLSVFPIYQDGGWSQDYFTYENGISDGRKAGKAAIDLKIPKGTVIYFAVDVDILGDDIVGTAVQYFKGVFESLSLINYYIGVYGTRNVCNQVISYNYARFAFVSDMSTGYSGNLGFSMPKEWAIDQFIEFTIGYGDGAVGIDNDAISGRDKGFNSLSNENEGSILSFIEYVKKVQKLADDYTNNNIEKANHLTAGYIRHFGYDGWRWNLVLGDVDNDFISLVDRTISSPQKIFTDKITGLTINADHLFAAMDGVILKGNPDIDIVDFGDAVSWFGDLVTICSDFHKYGSSYASAYDFAYDFIGADKNEGKASTFDNIDVISDVDGWNIGNQCINLGLKVADVFEKYYAGASYNRFNYFLENRFGFSRNNIQSAGEYGLIGINPFFVGFRHLIWKTYVGIDGQVATDSEMKAIVRAFGDKMFTLAEAEE